MPAARRAFSASSAPPSSLDHVGQPASCRNLRRLFAAPFSLKLNPHNNSNNNNNSNNSMIQMLPVSFPSASYSRIYMICSLCAPCLLRCTRRVLVFLLRGSSTPTRLALSTYVEPVPYVSRRPVRARFNEEKGLGWNTVVVSAPAVKKHQIKKNLLRSARTIRKLGEKHSSTAAVGTTLTSLRLELDQGREKNRTLSLDTKLTFLKTGRPLQIRSVRFELSWVLRPPLAAT